MTSLITEPQLIAAAAADVEQIHTAIARARAVLAGPTTGVPAAAGDEISLVTAQLFSACGQEYQALLQQAGAFHEQFVAALNAGSNAYAGAEAAAGVGLYIGGSGLPVPPQSYVTAVNNWVEFAFPPGPLPGNQHPLFTPEGLYPVTGVKSLPLNVSVDQGVQILESAIAQQFTAGHTTVDVLGYSQSAVISSLVMQALNPTNTPGGSLLPPGSQLNFTLIGDPMNPNGGLLERFAGLILPSLGFDFYGATPNNSFPTHIFTLQYDGYADFPKYPIDVLSDLNAFAGIYFVHGTYPDINPSALPPGDHLVTLPTSPGYSGMTTYDLITEPNLPLLDPVRAIPVIGTPIADLLQPDLTYLVNWGYGNPMYGYNTGYANVPTPFGVLPPLSATTALPGLLVSGAQQGATAFVNDISAMGPPSLPSLSATSGGGLVGALGLPRGLPPALSSPNTFIAALQTANTTATDFVTNAVAQSYATLLPTADIANALLTTMPSYDVNLFLSGIEQAIDGDPTGGLLYALGAPIAADTALVTLAGGFELEVLVNAVEAIP